MTEPTSWWKTKLANLIARHILPCHDMTRLISQAMDAPLPWRTRIAMWLHYRICIWCERYRAQLGLISKALKSSSEQGTEKMRGGLSPEARKRIKSAVQRRP